MKWHTAHQREPLGKLLPVSVVLCSTWSSKILDLFLEKGNREEHEGVLGDKHIVSIGKCHLETKLNKSTKN